MEKELLVRDGLFKKFVLPDGGCRHIPSDINLVFPENSSLPEDKRHFLAYIGWDDKLIKNVPANYQNFFKEVLPYLHCRTTDVHVAVCMPFVKKLVKKLGASVNEKIIYIAFILHDIGWSQLSEIEIADSLGIKGLKLNKEAKSPKEKHAAIGAELAEELLRKEEFFSPLSEEEKSLVTKAVLYHDKPEELAIDGDIPLEVKLVCDVDHLWSFTHENFWQDTVRKGISAEGYLENLKSDLDGYFITDIAKEMAREMLEEREKEVLLMIASSKK